MPQCLQERTLLCCCACGLDAANFAGACCWRTRTARVCPRMLFIWPCLCRLADRYDSRRGATCLPAVRPGGEVRHPLLSRTMSGTASPERGWMMMMTTISCRQYPALARTHARGLPCRLGCHQGMSSGCFWSWACSSPLPSSLSMAPGKGEYDRSWSLHKLLATSLPHALAALMICQPFS